VSALDAVRSALTASAAWMDNQARATRIIERLSEEGYCIVPASPATVHAQARQLIADATKAGKVFTSEQIVVALADAGLLAQDPEDAKLREWESDLSRKVLSSAGELRAAIAKIAEHPLVVHELTALALDRWAKQEDVQGLEHDLPIALSRIFERVRPLLESLRAVMADDGPSEGS
jgi:hypothetical protein